MQSHGIVKTESTHTTNTDEMGSFLSFLCFQLLPSYSSLESRLLLQDEVFLCEMTYFTWFYLCIWLSGTGPGAGGRRRARITESQKCRQRHLRDIIAEDTARPTCPSPAVGDCLKSCRQMLAQQSQQETPASCLPPSLTHTFLPKEEDILRCWRCWSNLSSLFPNYP